MSVRPAKHAGTFYPHDALAIGHAAHHYRSLARTSFEHPAAIIAPHAAWRFCGPVLATAFAGLVDRDIRKIVHLGPSHFQDINGCVAPDTTEFETPLGRVPVASTTSGELDANAACHGPEHALEVQLPLLQLACGAFDYVPLLVGTCAPELVADRLTQEGADAPDVLVVVSSDLSHYLPAQAAQRTDIANLRTIEALQPTLTPQSACGAHALNGLVTFAAHHDWRAMALDRRDSYQCGGGPSDCVVGYGAIGFYANEASR